MIYREQLGYMLNASYVQCRGRVGILFEVQSAKSPDYLDGRIEAFIHTIGVSMQHYHNILYYLFSLCYC